MKDQQELVAWHGALLLNAWVKKKVTVDMLLGREQKLEGAEALRAEMRKRNKRAAAKEKSLLASMTKEKTDVLQQIQDNEKWVEEVARSIREHDDTLPTVQE